MRGILYMKNFYEDVDVEKVLETGNEDYEFCLLSEKAMFKKDSVLVKKEDIEMLETDYITLTDELKKCKEMLRQFLNNEIVFTVKSAYKPNAVDDLIKESKRNSDEYNTSLTHEELEKSLKRQIEEER